MKYTKILQRAQVEFGHEYFMQICERRSAAAILRLIALIFQIVIFALFAFTLIPQGVVPRGTSTKDFREILLVMSATLGLAIPVIGHYHDVLTDILAARLQQRSNGDQDVRQMLKIAHGLELFPMPTAVEGAFEFGQGYRAVVRAFLTLIAATVAMMMLGALFVRFKVLEDIYLVPTYSDSVSAWVIGFVVVTDILGAFIFILSVGPLRARRHETTPEERLT